MTWRTGFTLTPGWSLLSLYKMNKILLVGPDPAWSEDAEPRHLFRKVPTRMPLAPTSPAHFFFLLIPPLSSHRWAPASPQTAHLTHSLQPPAKACPPSPLTLPPTPPVRRQLPESIQSGTQPLQRGRACRGRRETHSIHLHGNQTHSPPGSMLRKKNFNKPQNRPHIAP